MIKSLILYLKKHPSLVTLAIAVLTVGTLLITLVPTEYLRPGKIWQFDKLGHIFLFGIWTLFLGLFQMVRNPGSLRYSLVFIAGVSFGTLIEILQYLLPVNRNADIADIGADAIGCLVSIVILRHFANILSNVTK